ncbi:uncharacterized protein P174DRAFT_139369 [Aspergillus novofumigatus IBT 16806]|uniref:Uncharacterized protein n=1 Tax=Aspergillus novofumigatus (strain IBT 16806) TaxID=1392255 RepID=A0A2I1CDI0_ASPN1|nr:uncharacterized protein P174DRAFT_139369 [Aspergillus novofumigatus IBT 16806]PKX95676.1 hypothetical protein P174DRAFT_139369 [Aspergillus novofumigatus IBT 16806]
MSQIRSLPTFHALQNHSVCSICLVAWTFQSPRHSVGWACSRTRSSDILNPLSGPESPPVLTLFTSFLSLHIILLIPGYPFWFAIAFIYLVFEASNGFSIEIHTGHPKPNYLNIIIDA